jgi:hypothetical protein
VQALLKRRVALEESLNANRAKLARSRAAKRLRLELSKAVPTTSPTRSTQKPQEETVARGGGGEGAGISEKAEVGRFVTEEVAGSDEIGGLQIGSRDAEASSNVEGGAPVEQAVGGAGPSDGTGFAPGKPGKKEDSQTTGHIGDAEGATNAGRRPLPGRKRSQEALSAGAQELSTVLQKGAGVRESEGSAAKGSCPRLHAEAQGLIQAADVPPGARWSSKALEMEKGLKTSRTKCPNHADGKEQPSWSVDMEADTEPESESSQQLDPADAVGKWMRKQSRGDAEGRKGRLRSREVEADVNSGAVRRSSGRGELLGEANKEEERGSEEGNEGSSKWNAVAEDNEAREGVLAENWRKVDGNAGGKALFEHSGPFGQQGNMEDDSTEPLDDSAGSLLEMQDGQIALAPQEAEQSFGRSALEDDFAADRPAGWITAVRNRVTRLSNLGALEKAAGTQADGKVGAGTQGSGRASQRRAAGKAESADGSNMEMPKNAVKVPADSKHALSAETKGKGSQEKAERSDEIPEENTLSTPGLGKREKAAARVRVERADEIIQETEEQAWGGFETVRRRGVNRLGAGLTDRRRQSKGLRPVRSGEEVAGKEPEETGNVETTNDEHPRAERRASPGSGVDRENTSATSKASLEQGMGLETGRLQAPKAGGGGEHAEEAPAGPSKQDSSVGSAGKGTRKRLSLAPFKEAVQWMATEGGKEFAAQLRSEVTGGAAGCGFGEGGGSAWGGKPEMEELLTLAGLGGKDGVFTPSGSAREGRVNQGDEAGRPADVDTAQGLRIAADPVAVTTKRLERFVDPHCGDGLPALCGPEEGQLAHGDAARVSEELGRRASPSGALSDGTRKGPAVEMKPVPGALRIVGSDSLTEQQSEQQFAEADAVEGLEASEERPSGEELAAGAFVEGDVLGTVKEAGLERVEDAGLGGGRGRVPEKEAPGMLELDGAKTGGTLRGVLTTAWERGAEKLEAELCDVGAERTEKGDLQTSEKGGLTPLLHSREPTPPLGALGVLQAERAEKGRPVSPVVALEQSPGLASRKALEPPLPGRTSSWFGKAVDKISSAFKPQPPTGYKPLALTRSEHPPREVVSNAAQVAQLPKLDTGGGWLEKSRPRTKSWPVWKGPTSNPNLKKVGGSAQKAPLQGGVRPAMESWRASGIPLGSGGETEGKRSRALESQARRLGRFEESEAVRDWPVGDFLVPSTPPETAGEDIPLKELDALVNDVPKLGLVDLGGRPLDGPKSVSPALGQGPLRSVCCLVKQGGPVLWTVIHCAGQETRVGVCIEGDKAQRSVFVYDLCRGDEQTDWESDVVGVIPGTLRQSENEDQVRNFETRLYNVTSGSTLSGKAFKEPFALSCKRFWMTMLEYVLEASRKGLEIILVGFVSRTLLLASALVTSPGVQFPLSLVAAKQHFQTLQQLKDLEKADHVETPFQLKDELRNLKSSPAHTSFTEGFIRPRKSRSCRNIANRTSGSSSDTRFTARAMQVVGVKRSKICFRPFARGLDSSSSRQ